MEREVFAARLREAASRARDFARTYIEEPLLDPVLFRIRLNSSYDDNPRVGDEVVFPEDSTFERAHQLNLCDERQVIDELWRDGRVPEWVDVAAIGETGAATVLELLCCGRFTADDGLLYHAHEGRPPFHVTGPALPVGWQKGQKFSIYDRAECWSLHELEHLRAHEQGVWSLKLVGSVFDDEVLVKLPDLSRMEILELDRCSITSAALRPLSRCTRLRIVRIRIAGDRAFSLPRRRPKLPAIEVWRIA